MVSQHSPSVGESAKYLKKPISKPARARERVEWGLDHPEVLEIVRRHEQAVAARKHIRSLKRSTG